MQTSVVVSIYLFVSVSNRVAILKKKMPKCQTKIFMPNALKKRQIWAIWHEKRQYGNPGCRPDIVRNKKFQGVTRLTKLGVWGGSRETSDSVTRVNYSTRVTIFGNSDSTRVTFFTEWLDSREASQSHFCKTLKRLSGKQSRFALKEMSFIASVTHVSILAKNFSGEWLCPLLLLVNGTKIFAILIQSNIFIV